MKIKSAIQFILVIVLLLIVYRSPIAALVPLVAIGFSFLVARGIVGFLAQAGISAEVIDLRVLRPLDERTILESVARTRRAVIVDEGWKSGSLSAEVAARIMEKAFYELDAPVARVCSREVPVPYARHLEEATLPQVSGIVAAAKGVMSHA